MATDALRVCPMATGFGFADPVIIKIIYLNVDALVFGQAIDPWHTLLSNEDSPQNHDGSASMVEVTRKKTSLMGGCKLLQRCRTTIVSLLMFCAHPRRSSARVHC